MVAVVVHTMKQNMKVQLPILPDESVLVPKKSPETHRVLAIKLPLDIDISIQRERHWGVVLSLIALVLLFALSFLFMFSYHRQIQLYEYELADLRMKVSEFSQAVSQLSFTSSVMTSSSQEMQNAISEVASIVENCDCKVSTTKHVHRQKRDTEQGQTVAVKAVNEVNDIGDNASNETMRGNVKIHRQLVKNNRNGNGFGAVRASHFKGLLPEKMVEAGQIGPWYEDKQAMGDFGLRSCNLRDRGVKLIVNETGLYLIYAQVYYLTSKSLNSYSINVNPGNKPVSIPVAFCSANASLNDQGASEVSCYTSIVRRLQAGDAISLQQQERQRRLVMRDGHSFIGLVRLS